MRPACPARPRGQSWKTFLHTHAEQIWACDFLPVTDLFFRSLCAFFIIELHSRKVIHVGVTRVNVKSIVSRAPGRPARLRLVLRDRGGLALGVLHHWVNLWPSQKARTQRLILDALGQPPDDPRRLPKGGVCLPLLSPGLIQASQRRLDLPAFCWQAEVCGQPCCLAQVADCLLSLPLPRGEGRQ